MHQFLFLHKKLYFTGKPYKPKYTIDDCNEDEKGTTITLSKLKRKSGFDITALSRSLAKLFNFPDNFIVFLQLNDSEIIEITNKLKYEGIKEEFEWTLPDWLKEKEINNYEEYEEIKGKIITTEKPLKPGLRGITLFANGRMANSSEFFGSSESSHFFSYITGWLDVDFVDNWAQDVISTNRQSLDWENPTTNELRIFLTKVLTEIHKDWREKRKKKKRKSINEKTTVNIEDWYSKTPEPIQTKIEPLIEKIVEGSELSESDTNNIVTTLHQLLPEYTYYHYRYIHPEIARVSKKYYESGDFYTAFLEALKRYVAEVRNKSGSTNGSERSMMGEVFSNRKLSVTKSYKKTDGTNFSANTIQNIEEGQHYLSEGILIGGRNPLSHEEHIELSKTRLFSEKDCLDYLSLLSHLFKRLDDSEPI